MRSFRNIAAAGLVIVSASVTEVAIAASSDATEASRIKHEISWGMKYGALSESSKPESEGTETKAEINSLGFSASWGYLGRGSVEPIFELGYLNRTAKVGDVEEKGSYLSYGLGVLFNVTSADPDTKGMPFGGRRWIPYGGFLLGSETSTGSQTATAALKTDSGDMTTILVGGLRYVWFENVALNTQLRFSYTKSRNVGTAEQASGGTITRLNYELTPFNISVLF